MNYIKLDGDVLNWTVEKIRRYEDLYGPAIKKIKSQRAKTGRSLENLKDRN